MRDKLKAYWSDAKAFLLAAEHILQLFSLPLSVGVIGWFVGDQLTLWALEKVLPETDFQSFFAASSAGAYGLRTVCAGLAFAIGWRFR